MQETFYLLTTLLEYSDSISDGHTLYYSLEDALDAMAKEIEECQENFDPSHGEVVLDLERCREWRTEDGYGYTVTIEAISPL